MVRLVLRSLLNQKRRSLLFILGLLLILSTIPITMVSLKQAVVQVDNEITTYARGSYDILVRPGGSRTEIEKELGIVEENYLAAGNGGISLDEWKRIKGMESVGVAAPVASLGYFTGSAMSFSTWDPDQSARVRAEFFTSDGLRDYPIDKKEEDVSFVLEQEAVPGITEGFDLLGEPSGNQSQEKRPFYLLPNTFHIMAAVDPESEEKLTGIQFNEIKSGQDYDKDQYQFAGDSPVIPLMNLVDPNVPLKTRITWEKLAIDKDQTMRWKKEVGTEATAPLFVGDQEKVERLYETLLNFPAEEKETYEVDFSSAMKPFVYEPFKVNKDKSISTDYSSYMTDLSSTSLFYSAKPAAYTVDQKKDSLLVKQEGEFMGVPTYREFEKKGGTVMELYGELPFVLNPNGEYTVRDTGQKLSSSPLGIYQMAPIHLIKDGAGREMEKPVELHSTIFPGSFVPSPAHGLINVADSVYIKGEKPIDAIRIRVKGIDQYDEAAKVKIEETAKELLSLGYEVDIVAGASYQNIEVVVEGLGTVTQPWTTLGAAAAIVDGWSGTTALLIVFFGISSIVYLANRLYFFRKTKAAEVQLLFQLGWDERKIKRLIRTELGLLVHIAWALSITILALLNSVMDISSLVSLLGWNIPLAAVVLLFMIIAAEWSWKQLLNGKRKAVRGRKKKKRTSMPSSSLMLALKSIAYYKRFILPTFVQIALAGFLNVFVFLSVNSTVRATSKTMLGEYVNFQVSSLHFIILGSAGLIAVITLIESLSSLFLLRKNEIAILQTIGWEYAHIAALWLRELAIWTGLAVLIGHSLGLIAIAALFPITGNSIVILLASIGAFFALLWTIGVLLMQISLKRNGRIKTTMKKNDNSAVPMG